VEPLFYARKSFCSSCTFLRFSGLYSLCSPRTQQRSKTPTTFASSGQRPAGVVVESISTSSVQVPILLQTIALRKHVLARGSNGRQLFAHMMKHPSTQAASWRIVLKDDRGEAMRTNPATTTNHQPPPSGKPQSTKASSLLRAGQTGRQADQQTASPATQATPATPATELQRQQDAMRLGRCGDDAVRVCVGVGA